MITTLWVLALVQQPAQVVTRVVVEPGNLKISIGDTVRLHATAFDAAGQPVSAVTVRWLQSGGRFEGAVDSTGLVTGGATGTIVATVMVRAVGAGRPVIAVSEITVLPLPVSRVVVEPEMSSMVVGQSLTIRATPFASIPRMGCGRSSYLMGSAKELSKQFRRIHYRECFMGTK